MKITLLVLLLASSSAFTQDRLADEKLWHVLNKLMDGTTDESIIEHLAHHGLKPEKIQPLQEYVLNGRKALYEQAKADWVRQCSQRSTLNKDGLVAELEEADRRYAAVLHGIIENLALIVSDGDLRTLQDLAADSHITVVLADAAGKVRAGEMPPEKLLDRTCELAAEGAAP